MRKESRATTQGKHTRAPNCSHNVSRAFSELGRQGGAERVLNYAFSGSVPSCRHCKRAPKRQSLIAVIAMSLTLA